MTRLLAIGFSALVACAAPNDSDGATSNAAVTSSAGPSDPAASPATRTVLANLRSFGFASVDPFDHRVIIGQQDADVSNRSSYGTPITSDIERLAGHAPALVSYELSNVDRGAMSTFDPAAFRSGRSALHDLIVAQHKRGALVSLVWHMRCPKASLTENDHYAPDQCPSDYRLEELLAKKSDGTPGVHFREWRSMLDELADLLSSLKDDQGQSIPVQIRPFHEYTGQWFWWGRANSPGTYSAAWRELVSYLRDSRGVHNALWVLAPAAPADNYGWDAFYPGDPYVDVVAFDRYDGNDGYFGGAFEADLRTVEAFARQHGKVAAVAEVGIDLEAPQTVDPAWFTRLLGTLSGHSFAYAALWRNAPWEKYIPEPGDGAIADDFTKMAHDPAALLTGEHDLYLPLHVP